MCSIRALQTLFSLRERERERESLEDSLNYSSPLRRLSLHLSGWRLTTPFIRSSVDPMAPRQHPSWNRPRLGSTSPLTPCTRMRSPLLERRKAWPRLRHKCSRSTMTWYGPVSHAKGSGHNVHVHSAYKESGEQYTNTIYNIHVESCIVCLTSTCILCISCCAYTQPDAHSRGSAPWAVLFFDLHVHD